MLERLRRFSALDSEARGIFWRAAIVLPLISLSLKLRGFRATQEFLLGGDAQSWNARAQGADCPPVDAKTIQVTARMVNAAVRNAWPACTCLEKSLALCWLLGRQDISAQLRIGARKVDGKFEAHAWVECGGAPINELGNVHRHYATFDKAFPVQSSEAS